MISTTTTKAPSYAGAFAVRGTTAVEHSTAMPVRLRRTDGGPATGLPIGIGVQLNSDIPGDLPPRDPLS